MEDLSAALSLKYFDGRKEEPQLDRRDQSFSPRPSEVWNEYQRGALDLTLSGKSGRWEGMLMGYRNFGDHLFSDGWDSGDYTNGAILHACGSLFPANTLILGFDFRHQGGEVVSGPLAGKWDKKEYAVFFHDEHILMRRLNLTFGARYNDDEVAGGQFCPQVGLVWHLSAGGTLRGLVNKGFRSPQINELYIFPTHNMDLAPEIVWNYELGAHRRLFSAMELDLAGFLMKGENMIQLAPNGTSSKFSLQNAGQFEFRGLEASLTARPVEDFQVQASYTHLDPGTMTSGRPGDKVDLSLRWIRRRPALSCRGQYATNYYAQDGHAERIPDYFIWDAKLSYELLGGAQLFLAIDNLFDDSYTVYANLPGSSAGLYTMPRRRFTTGLSVRW
jgi:iron complex outermembrane receptor protein